MSYASELFTFGDGTGIGASSVTSCDEYGPWDPPAPGSASTTETRNVRHTYDAPGAYTAKFAFEAGPFDCVDSASGVGDRTYASSAAGSATVVIMP